MWNKKTICRLLISVFLLVVVGSGCKSQQNRRELKFYYRADYFNLYDLSDSAFPDSESLETVAKQYIKEIEDVLGVYH